MLAGTDSCGMLYWMSLALNMYSDRYRAIHVKENKHPYGFHYSKLIEELTNDEIEDIVDKVDFIQIGHSHYPYVIGKVEVPFEKVKGQYHTGTHYRLSQKGKEELSKEFGIQLSFATPDLCKFPGGDHLVSLPYPIDTDYLCDFDRSEEFIVHSPSSDIMKGSKDIDPVLSDISDKHSFPSISTRVISWDESILLKARALLYVDHLFDEYNSFGISAVEAAILGAIPFAMGNNFNMEGCPFVIVNNARELYEQLDYYLSNRDILEVKAKECREWALANFSLEKTCRILEEHYDKISC